VIIAFVHRVPSVKFHEPHRIDAAHGSSGNHPSSRQVLGGVRDAADILPSGIKRVRVNVESTLGSVNEDEVALPRIGLGPLLESATRHQVAQQPHLRVRYRDIQIVVATSLPSEQSVYSPTTVDVDDKPALFEEVEQVNDI
jgi:hypothetical protein